MTDQITNNLSEARVPFMLGVTGHRDLRAEDLDKLRNTIRKICQELHRDYPHTPLVLLSPLAEGADRLAAEVALEPETNARLVTVLAWPADECPEGVCRLEDEADFRRLLAASAQTIALPLLPGVNRQQLNESAECRELHYDQVGKFIARHSQILIAIWDGVDAAEGGTAKVIRWQREGAPAPLATRAGIIDSVERGAVFHIVTPRIGGEAQADALTLKQFWPGSEAQQSASAKASKHIWQNIDRFNQYAGLLEQKYTVDLDKSKGYLIPAATQADLPDKLPTLLQTYSLADVASQHFQRRTLSTTAILFIGAFVAVAALEIYAHFFTHWPVLLLHLLLLLAGYSLYRISQRLNFQPRYLDYRALAEALRVQIFWSWAGLGDAVADHYLRHFRGELDWIRYATRACFVMSANDTKAGTANRSRDEIRRRLREVRNCWIVDQYNYFTKKGPQNEQRELRFEIAVRFAFSLAIVIAIVLVGVELLTHHPSHVLLLALFLALVTSALLEDYSTYRAYAIHSRKYHWMAELYSTAAERMEQLLQAGDFDRAQQLVWELGKEALTENADWVVQQRNRLPTWHSG